MRNETIHTRELSTIDFSMKEINDNQAKPVGSINQEIGKFFCLLAAAQILQIAGGAVMGFFVAPASLFVSRDEAEAFYWIAVAVFGFAQIALGVILLSLSLIAANAFRKEKSWRKFAGTLTSGTAILSFPFGTIIGAMLLVKIFSTRK